MGEGIEGAEGKAMGSREEEDYRKGNMTKGKGERRGRRGRKGKGAGAPHRTCLYDGVDGPEPWLSLLLP